MTCDEVAELLGAYALDALPPDEAEAVRAHLAGCPDQAEEARELRSAASRLAATPDAVAPPPALRSRLLAAVASTPQDASVADATADRIGWSASAPASGAMRPASPGSAKVVQLPRRTAIAWGAIAAVFVGAFVGLLAWNVVLQTRGDSDVQRLAERASSVATLEPHGAQGSGVVIFYREEKRALVVGDGLRPLDASANTYQLWAIGAVGAPRSIGLMQPGSDGHAIVVVPFDPTSAQALALTIEPVGGSDQPTSEPIFTAAA